MTGACWAIIGSATTFAAKLRGPSATTVIDSITHRRVITRSISTSDPASTETLADRVSKPGRADSTRYSPAATGAKAKVPSGPVTAEAAGEPSAAVRVTATPGRPDPVRSETRPATEPAGGSAARGARKAKRAGARIDTRRTEAERAQAMGGSCQDRGPGEGRAG